MWSQSENKTKCECNQTAIRNFRLSIPLFSPAFSVDENTLPVMSQSSPVNFLRKALRCVKTRRNFSRLILSTCLVTLIVLCFVNHQRHAHVPIHHDFDWLRNRNHLPLFMRPEQSTAVIVPHSGEAFVERQFIACFVMSAPGNFIARYAIRQTWGKAVKPLFFIAVGDNATMAAVQLEAMTFNDIIVEDFVDAYLNLTVKVAFAMKYFVSHFQGSKYFFKIDDDVFVNVENLHQMLEKAPNNSLIGRLESHSKPIRDEDNKWFIPSFLFDHDEFPPYLDGPAYIIPGHMIRSIYETSMKIPFLNLEDVYFTGIVAGRALGYSLYDERRFRVLALNFHWTCMYKQDITVHGIDADAQIRLWEDFRTKQGCNVIQLIIAYYKRKQLA